MQLLRRVRQRHGVLPAATDTWDVWVIKASLITMAACALLDRSWSLIRRVLWLAATVASEFKKDLDGL